MSGILRGKGDYVVKTISAENLQDLEKRRGFILLEFLKGAGTIRSHRDGTISL